MSKNSVHRKIKICNISPKGYTGIAYYDHCFCQSLFNIGIEVIFITSKKWLVNTDKIRVSYKLKKYFVNTYGNISRIKKGLAYISGMTKTYFYVMIKKIKIIHFQSLELSLVDLIIFILLKISRKKIVYSPHDITSFKFKENKIILNMTFWLSDILVVHNPANETLLIHRYNIKKKKIQIIIQGNYNTFLSPEKTQKEAREIINVPKDKKIILMFGNIRAGKGMETAVKAFRLLKDKANLLLLVAGKPNRGYDMRTIKEEIRTEDMREHTILRDYFIEDDLVEAYYKASDIVLVPYDYIYTSATLCYAFSCGLATVISDVKEFSEFAIDGENCLIFKAGDRVDLAEKIDFLLKNPDMAQKIARNAKELSDDAWDWNKTAEKLEKIYQAL